MSGRSSAPEWVAILLALGACGKSSAADKAQAAPAEADPAKVGALAATILANTPSPGGARECKPADLAHGVAMTQDTLLRLAGKPVPNDPEHSPWMNPVELDDPSARTLVDPKAGAAARQAAAVWLAAPFYLVYRVDNVDAPLALGVKELKIGTIGARVMRFEKDGRPGCVQVVFWQNDKAVSDQAIAESDKTLVDPKIALRLRADLTAQYLKTVPRP